jgi:preprotein translocase subunit SecA
MAAAAASPEATAAHEADAGEAPAAAPIEQRRVDDAERIGRNDPCWCGSGKKFKKCHGAAA